MNNIHSFSDTKAGTAGGTLTILLANIYSGDVLKTALLAAIGATVSFITSYLLKKIVGKKNK